MYSQVQSAIENQQYTIDNQPVKRKIKNMRLSLLLLLFGGLMLHFACTPEDNFYTQSDARLEFSTDTIRFDTVFTELGSATRFVKVYNPYNQPIRIDRIFLADGANSSFRMNVDGFPGAEATDLEIAANDSLYVFTEVTVDPDQPISVSPYVIQEQIGFEINGNEQRVQLEAWGQNANYFPNRFNKGGVTNVCTASEITWDDPKPYVIYGIMFVSGCTLNIPPGTRIYVHGGIVMDDELGVYNDGYIFVTENGRINVQGTAEEPVVFQGDRLEEPFQEISGQWTGIILGKGSKGNQMNYTTVKNSRFGVFVDSTANLTLRNSQIYNTVGNGLVGFHSTIEAENTLIYNNGGNSVQFINGGTYDMTYCTVASYGVDAEALGMSNFFCYDADCEVFRTNRLRANFKNSIFYGSKQDEIVLSDVTSVSDGQIQEGFDYQFDNCIVRVDELLDNPSYANFFDFCANCPPIDSRDPLFFDTNDDDYRLDSLSVAQDRAMPIPNLSIDLVNYPRDPMDPDIGAYEYQE